MRLKLPAQVMDMNINALGNHARDRILVEIITLQQNEKRGYLSQGQTEDTSHIGRPQRPVLRKHAAQGDGALIARITRRPVFARQLAHRKGVPYSWPMM